MTTNLFKTKMPSILQFLAHCEEGAKLLRGILHLNNYAATNMGLVLADPNLLLAHYY